MSRQTEPIVLARYSQAQKEIRISVNENVTLALSLKEIDRLLNEPTLTICPEVVYKSIGSR